MAEYNIPGVYSQVDASAAVNTTGASDNVIGIVAQADNGTDNQPYAPLSYNDAVTRYGENSNLVKLMKTAMENGGNKFILVKVKKSDDYSLDYESAFSALDLEEAVNIVITDATDPLIHASLKTHVYNASDNSKERIAIVGFAPNTDQNTVQTSAATLNGGRIYTSYPNPLDSTGAELDGIYSAAAIAGQIAAETDPSMPMTNVQLKGFYGLAKKLTISEMDSLIENGVIPLQVRNGSITIVRAISTYTKNDAGKDDTTWQELTTQRTSDAIMKDLRDDLASKFARAKQNARTREAIKTEVVNKLLSYQDLEWIENVDPENDVSIEVNPTNPLRNDLDFKFDITGPLNVINIIGHLVI